MATARKQQTCRRGVFTIYKHVRLFATFVLAALVMTAYQARPEPAHALNGAPSKTVVINEIYGGGGNASATFTNDFVELVNNGNAATDVSAWSIQYQSTAATTWTVVNLCTSIAAGTCVIQPGRFYLVVLASGGAVGASLPASDAPAAAGLNLAAAQGKIALVNSRTALPSNTGSNCSALPITGAPAVIDEVGYGTSSNACFEGTGPAPGNTNSATSTARVVAFDTDQNSTNFTTTSPPTPQNSASAPISPTAADGIVNGRIVDSNGSPIAGAVVNLSGSQTRKTITDTNGNYRFDNVETSGFYTVAPASANFSFSPAERSFSQLGNSTEATFTATPASGFVNKLDTPEYFVRQHYLDFLGREPDESGFNFWSDQILACGNDAACSERKAVNVSAAYFLSVEFQQTGGLVDRLYKASYARNPLFAEFMPDNATIARGVVVGRSGWEQQLLSNKQSFIESWVERPAFQTAFGSLSNENYVATLLLNTGVSFTQSERDSLTSGLSGGTLSRADVLARIASNDNFAKARFNEAFVMMEYFGYLRRDPDASGYAFWLDKLNQFDGNFERAEMVKAFITSGEYGARFAR